MRYESLKSFTGKTTSDQRIIILQLLFGIIVGNWIGRTYLQGPKCVGLTDSEILSGSKVHDQVHKESNDAKVIIINMN